MGDLMSKDDRVQTLLGEKAAQPVTPIDRPRIIIADDDPRTYALTKRSRCDFTYWQDYLQYILYTGKI